MYDSQSLILFLLLQEITDWYISIRAARYKAFGLDVVDPVTVSKSNRTFYTLLIIIRMLLEGVFTASFKLYALTIQRNKKSALPEWLTFRGLHIKTKASVFLCTGS